MTPEAREGLQALASALPPGSAVSVPREWLLELLGGPAVRHHAQRGAAPADLTVADLSARFGRQVSTVRGWVERGLFPGAYRFQGREWRIPAASLEAFESRQRKSGEANRPGTMSRSAPVADLSDWREAS